MLKKILPYIFLVIGAWVIYSLVFTRYELKTDVLNYERMIQELEADSLEIKLNESDTRIKQLNSRIYVIKRETQKQLNAVDLFGDDQLEQFFARRYRESDSIN
jgi:hypothetical protein